MQGAGKEGSEALTRVDTIVGVIVGGGLKKVPLDGSAPHTRIASQRARISTCAHKRGKRTVVKLHAEQLVAERRVQTAALVHLQEASPSPAMPQCKLNVRTRAQH